MNSLNFGNLGIYYLILLAMITWTAIRVGRESTGMGFASFFCWPIAVIPLITNWGNRDSDIRLPFLLTVLAFGLLMHESNKIGDQVAMQFSAEDIELLRQQDPETAAEIERRQSQVTGEMAATEAPAAAAVTAPARADDWPPTSSEMDFAAAPAEIRKIPLEEIRFHRGSVRLLPAFATLQVPEHFRFVRARQLGALAEIRGVTVDDQTLGWIVHERVDLRSPHFWYVDVQFHDVGHLAAPQAAAQAQPAIQWLPEQSMATWTQAAATGASTAHDRFAVRLLRHGALVFRVSQLQPSEQELGLRAARLMAERSITDPGWAYADFIGDQPAQTFEVWRSTLTEAPGSAVEVDDASVERHDS
jgi:hypothetical protein